MPHFRLIEKADPTNDIGPEMGLFDGCGMLAACYRQHYDAFQVWEWPEQHAGTLRYLILDTEERARAFCIRVAVERGLVLEDEPPPDLDAMFKENLSH